MASAGSRLLCGVELISPNAACAIARASSGASAAVPAAQLRGPQVDVLALEAAHPLACLGRQRLPVAVLDDDQRGLGERELHVPVDERRQRVAGAVGARHAFAGPRPAAAR